MVCRYSVNINIYKNKITQYKQINTNKYNNNNNNNQRSHID